MHAIARMNRGCVASQLLRGEKIEARLHMSSPTSSQVWMWICCYHCSFWHKLHLLQCRHVCVCVRIHMRARVWDLFPSQTFHRDLAGRRRGQSSYWDPSGRSEWLPAFFTAMWFWHLPFFTHHSDISQFIIYDFVARHWRPGRIWNPRLSCKKVHLTT